MELCQFDKKIENNNILIIGSDFTLINQLLSRFQFTGDNLSMSSSETNQIFCGIVSDISRHYPISASDIINRIFRKQVRDIEIMTIYTDLTYLDLERDSDFLKLFLHGHMYDIRNVVINLISDQNQIKALSDTIRYNTDYTIFMPTLDTRSMDLIIRNFPNLFHDPDTIKKFRAVMTICYYKKSPLVVFYDQLVLKWAYFSI
jgi:hypothetical protein